MVATRAATSGGDPCPTSDASGATRGCDGALGSRGSNTLQHGSGPIPSERSRALRLLRVRSRRTWEQ
ncbi:hypothetical protein TZ00_07245 [Agreia bicolorata]|uniref:Uncharacterized protein n=1 Tax=Agreia bicolorata TaxID=110935 RepID=A0ABR5CFB8_9MICO|nr:hypothetical protein TZ00_07245 [Agreia bicolorata]